MRNYIVTITIKIPVRAFDSDDACQHEDATALIAHATRLEHDVDYSAKPAPEPNTDSQTKVTY